MATGDRIYHVGDSSGAIDDPTAPTETDPDDGLASLLAGAPPAAMQKGQDIKLPAQIYDELVLKNVAFASIMADDFRYLV